jgi:uncharacterized protein (DUF302 family)
MISEIGFEIKIQQPFERVLNEVIEALKREGFGVLTRIDVRETLEERLGVDFRSYTILGACNPPLALRALTEDAVSGLLLPCNVTVESDEFGGSIVRLANPEVMLAAGSFENNLELKSVAREARSKIERVAESLIIR